MTFILSLLGKISPTAYLYLAIALIIGALSISVHHYYSAYQDELVGNGVLISKNKDLDAQIQNLTNIIKADSEAIDKYAAESKAREDAAKVALAKAQQEAKKYAKQAQDLLMAQATGPDACTSANILFNDYLTGLRAQ